MTFPINKIAVLLILFVGLISPNTYGQTSEENGAIGTVDVVGRSSMKLPADYVQIQINVSARNASAKVAHQEVTDEMSRAIAFLRKNEDITGISTDWVRLNTQRTGPRSESVEYFASSSLSFKLYDLKQYDQVMLQLIEMGINGIGGISFRSSKEKEFDDILLQLALDDAKRKATLMAEQYQQQLGKAILISDATNSGNRPYMMEYKSAAMDSSGPSVKAGEIEISSSVKVQFELK